MKYDQSVFQSEKPLVFSNKDNLIIKMLAEVSIIKWKCRALEVRLICLSI